MRSLVVFDSYFGNTEMVARAIAEALAAAGPVRTLRVDEVLPGHLADLDLLVVGAPTRAFRPSPAIQAWLKGLPPAALDGVRVAAFDTRVDVASVGNRFLTTMVRWFGYAAEPIERALLRSGGERAAAPAGFVVDGKTGPLRAGESDRARAWARGLVG
jgi:flavodoxin